MVDKGRREHARAHTRKMGGWGKCLDPLKRHWDEPPALEREQNQLLLLLLPVPVRATITNFNDQGQSRRRPGEAVGWRRRWGGGGGDGLSRRRAASTKLACKQAFLGRLGTLYRPLPARWLRRG